MSVEDFEHVFINARDLERTKRFYCDALGFQVMPRPALPMAGYWLGVNGKVQVHMAPMNAHAAATVHAKNGLPAVGHVAFSATDPAGTAAKLHALGIPARKRWRADLALAQIFVEDPNGLTIELNFAGIRDEPQWEEAAGRG